MIRKEGAYVQRQYFDTANKSRKLAKEMLGFWRKNEKEERETRRKAEKEVLDRRKLEIENREQNRQKKKLEFLLTQTELYAHFMAKKLPC